MATFHAELFAQHPDAYSPPMRARFDEARRRTALDYVAAQRARERIRHVLWTVFDQVDVLVAPTVPATATPIGSDNAAFGDRQLDMNSLMTRFTYPFNLSGFPSLAVPAGFDDQGLPTGVQIAGPPWREALLLRVGHAFQRATDWHTRRPPLPAADPRVRGAAS
jgi:aspartyl-tRNA(Asn)/glutamyl-tRNA(Gln) amidotransferase subunit A